jgi:Protein of unknown function (DUF3017)
MRPAGETIMTPETKQAPNGYFRRPRMSSGATPQAVPVAPGTQSPVRAAGTPVRSGESVRSVEPVGAAAPPAMVPAPATVPTPTIASKHAREDGSIVGIIPYLAVLVCTIAGVYVAWHQGSAGGGKGGVVGGIALLVAAVVRLVVPARLVGLLGTRNRVIDVLTLAIFGGGLLIAGLVLPR